MIKNFEEFLKKEKIDEASLTNKFDGFLIYFDVDDKEVKYKCRYQKGVKNTKVENEAFYVLSKKYGLPESHIKIGKLIKKGEFENEEAQNLIL